MTSSAEMTQALIGFARTLTAGYDVSDVLHDLTDRVAAVLGIAGAGVSLREDGGLRFVTAGTEATAALEQVQELYDEGPCAEASRTGRRVSVAYLPDAARRWPRYTAVAARVGMLAVAAIPMRAPERIGVLDLYVARRHDWTPEELSIAGVFTDVAAAYVLHASQLERERRTVEQLQEALDSRVVIEQAKGIVAAERRIDVDAAFAVLRKYANDHNATLRTVATAVVDDGLRP